MWSYIEDRPTSQKGQSYFPGAFRPRGARPGWVDVPLVRLEPDRCAIDLLGTWGQQGVEGSWWRGCRPHAARTYVSLAPRRGVAGAEADSSHSGAARTKTYGVDVPFMQLERHGWDIHAVSAELDRAAGRVHGSRQCARNTGASGVGRGGRRPESGASAGCRDQGQGGAGSWEPGLGGRWGGARAGPGPG